MREERLGRQGFWLFVCMLLLCLGLWIQNLNTPFSRVFGFADYISNENGRIAENHLRYGLLTTQGDQIRNLEEAPKAEWVHYNNHPGTLDVLTAGVLAVTGSTDPWAKRLLSLLATLGSFVLVGALARRSQASARVAMALFLTLPLTLIHGVNLSYEPLALFWMLWLVLLAERGWRWRLVPLLWMGGLIDFPVLYLGPWFALRALWDSRGRSFGPSILFAGALAAACLVSLGTHLLHVAWTMGGLQANSGQDWWGHILMSLQSRGHSVALGEFLLGQAQFFLASFTLPVLLLGLFSFWPRSWSQIGLQWGRGPGVAALAFLFAGSLHLLLFRAHAMVHDFWLAYYAPFFALAGAAFLVRLPRAASVFVLVFVCILGLGSASRIWQERSAVPVRAVASDLEDLFDSEVVLHSLLAPAGWALESYRGHPVLDAGDLLQQPFTQYLDRVGSRGYLGRPQRLFVPVSALTETWALHLDSKVLPGASKQELRGASGLWWVYDIGPLLLDPGLSPYLMDKSVLLQTDPQRISAAERQRLMDRARKFLVLRLFAPGSDIDFLDGREGGYESLLARRIRSAGAKALEGSANLVAWHGTNWAQQLRDRHGEAVQRVTVRAAGKPATVWVRKP